MSRRHVVSEHYLFKNASITAALAGAGAVSGLLLDALILYKFGAGRQTDALFAALTVPALLSGVVSIQGPKVIVPLFSALFGSERPGEAWPLLRNLLTTCLLVFAAVALSGIVLSSFIVLLQIPGLDAETVALAGRLSRFLFVLALCQGLGSILQSVLYARHSYVVSCTGKLVMNLVTIPVVFAGGGRFGIAAVAAGMVCGSVVQLGLLGAVLARHGFRYRWSFHPSEPALRAVLGSLGYPMSGHVLGESAGIVQNILGSFLGSGSLTLLRYAARIVQALAGILLSSVVQVTMPLMAQHAAAKDLDGQRRSLLESIQLLTLIGTPICVWLFFVAEPLVVLCFQRGQFAARDAVIVAALIHLMIPDFIFGRLVSVMQTMFYVNGDLRTPFISTVIYTVVNIAGSVALAHWIGVRGIALGVSLASMSNLLYMIFMLRRSYGSIGWSGMRTFALRLVATSAAAAIGFALGANIGSALAAPTLFDRLLVLGIPSACGFALFVAGVVLFRLFDKRLIAPVAAAGAS